MTPDDSTPRTKRAISPSSLSASVSSSAGSKKRKNSSHSAAASPLAAASNEGDPANVTPGKHKKRSSSLKPPRQLATPSNGTPGAGATTAKTPSKGTNKQTPSKQTPKSHKRANSNKKSSEKNRTPHKKGRRRSKPPSEPQPISQPTPTEAEAERQKYIADLRVYATQVLATDFVRKNTHIALQLALNPSVSGLPDYAAYKESIDAVEPIGSAQPSQRRSYNRQNTSLAEMFGATLDVMYEGAQNRRSRHHHSSRRW